MVPPRGVDCGATQAATKSVTSRATLNMRMPVSILSLVFMFGASRSEPDSPRLNRSAASPRRSSAKGQRSALFLSVLLSFRRLLLGTRLLFRQHPFHRQALGGH